MNTAARITQRPATYQDVLDAPEHMVAEIIRGALHLQPRPRPRHARATTRLTGRLGPAFDNDDGDAGDWWILVEPELHLGDDVLVPDLAGWRRERMPVFPDTAFFTLSPDWACEVLSPSTRARDLTDKRAIYAEHGVAHLWLVDPDARTFEAFALQAGLWVLTAALRDDAPVSVAPFDAVTFPLDSLWVPDGTSEPEA